MYNDFGDLIMEKSNKGLKVVQIIFLVLGFAALILTALCFTNALTAIFGNKEDAGEALADGFLAIIMIPIFFICSGISVVLGIFSTVFAAKINSIDKENQIKPSKVRLILGLLIIAIPVILIITFFIISIL